MQRNLLKYFNIGLNASHILLSNLLLIVTIRHVFEDEIEQYINDSNDSCPKQIQKFLLYYMEMIASMYVTLMFVTDCHKETLNETRTAQIEDSQQKLFKKLGVAYHGNYPLVQRGMFLAKDNSVEVQFIHLLRLYNFSLNEQKPNHTLTVGSLQGQLTHFIQTLSFNELSSNNQELMCLWMMLASVKCKFISLNNLSKEIIDPLYRRLDAEVDKRKLSFHRPSIDPITTLRKALLANGYELQTQHHKVFTFFTVQGVMIDIAEKDQDYYVTDSGKSVATIAKMLKHRLLQQFISIQDVICFPKEEISKSVANLANVIIRQLQKNNVMPLPKVGHLNYFSGLPVAGPISDIKDSSDHKTPKIKHNFLTSGNRTYNSAKTQQGKRNKERLLQQEWPPALPLFNSHSTSPSPQPEIKVQEIQQAKPHEISYEEKTQMIFRQYQGCQTKSLIGYKPGLLEKNSKSLATVSQDQLIANLEKVLQEKLAQKEFFYIKNELEKIDSTSLTLLVGILIKIYQPKEKDRHYLKLFRYCVLKIDDELMKIQLEADADQLFCYSLILIETKKKLLEAGLIQEAKKILDQIESILKIIKSKLQVKSVSRQATTVKNNLGELVVVDKVIQLTVDITQPIHEQLDEYLAADSLLMLQAIQMAGEDEAVLDANLIAAIKRQAKLLHPDYVKAMNSHSIETFNQILQKNCMKGRAAFFFNKLIELEIYQHLFPICYTTVDDNNNTWSSWILPTLEMLDNCCQLLQSNLDLSYITALVCAKELREFSPEERIFLGPYIMNFYRLTTSCDFSQDPIEMIGNLYAQVHTQPVIFTPATYLIELPIMPIPSNPTMLDYTPKMVF